MREAGQSPNDIVEMYSGNLSLRLISKLMKNRENIIKAAASEQKQMFKIQPGRKYSKYRKKTERLENMLLSISLKDTT